MKRICAFLLSLLMVLTMIPAVALAASYRYATDPVMFRTGPSTKYAVITELQTGEQVEFLGTSGNWSRVKWNGQTGYVFTKYLSADKIVSNNYRYASEPVNMRSGPSTRYSIITELDAGERVEYLGVSGSWTKVKLDGRTGYVFTKYLSSSAGNTDETNFESPLAATATSNGINVRSGPGTSYRKLGTIKKWQTVPVTGASGDWLKIEWENGNAYVHNRYFKTQDAAHAMADALERSGYFKTNASLFIGTFINHPENVLNIRVSKGDISKINEDLKTLLSDIPGSYRVVFSSLPSYVNQEYIKELTNTIFQRYDKLSSNDKALCDFTYAGYDIVEDKFVVSIVNMNNAKKEFFRQHIINWEPITFESVDHPIVIEKPM